MHIHTVEEDYEYRMKNIMKKFVKDYGLESIDDPETLQDTLWYDYAEKFAHAVLQDMNDFSGDELFEIGEWWYMKTITVTIEIYDNSSVEDIERAVSAGLDSNGIDCTYDVEEIKEWLYEDFS